MYWCTCMGTLCINYMPNHGTEIEASTSNIRHNHILYIYKTTNTTIQKAVDTLIHGMWKVCLL